MKKILLLCAILSCGFLGCGSSDGSLNTSTVTATVDILVMDSDVVSWVDPITGAKAIACAETSIPAVPLPDSVNVSVNSRAYSNTGSTGLPIRIESATISYTPANSVTPPMTSEFQIIGMTIANGGTATVPVRVATQEQKMLLLQTLACNNIIYNYYTKIIFNISEIGTDKKTSVDASVQLRLADFIDL